MDTREDATTIMFRCVVCVYVIIIRYLLLII